MPNEMKIRTLGQQLAHSLLNGIPGKRDLEHVLAEQIDALLIQAERRGREQAREEALEIAETIRKEAALAGEASQDRGDTYDATLQRYQSYGAEAVYDALRAAQPERSGD